MFFFPLKYYGLLVMWIKGYIKLLLYECETVNSQSKRFSPGEVSFDACAMVDMLVHSCFLKDGGKNASFRNMSQCVAMKLVTVLTVGYCVRIKN
jgi:hypothetical protein